MKTTQMCISVEGTQQKSLASKFLVIMEIIKKLYAGTFWGNR